MDERRFDDLTRLLGASGSRRTGLRAALGGLLGVGLAAGAAAPDADAKGKDTGKGKGRAGAARRRHECGPDAPCPTGFDCVKQGKKRRCACSTGIVCEGACCPTGQVCRNGACTVPAACIAPGEPCKGVGIPCCEGRTCSSGQGGQDDIACYVHKTGACRSTADCVYGTACIDGRCGFDVPPPAATGAPCNATVGQQCADPAAECVAYDGPDAPSGEAGTYCTLPLNRTCVGDPDCTCYKCWYENPGAEGTTRAARAGTLSTRLACCGPAGYTCKTDRNCCLGSVCVNGVCQSETTCDVCQGGGCPYSSIKAAYDAVNGSTPVYPAGSTIKIAPGAYVEDPIFLNRDVTFRRCGDSGTVTWSNVSQGNSYLLNMPSSGAKASRVDLGFLDLAMKPGQNIDYLMDLQGVSISQRFTLTALGCSFAMVNTSSGYSTVRLRGFTDADFTGCTFSGIRVGNSNNGPAINSSGNAGGRNQVSVTRSRFFDNSGSSGGAVYVGRTDLMVTDSIFEGNTARAEGGAIHLAELSTDPCSASLRNCRLTGNTADAAANKGGGAIWVGSHCTLSLSGTTSITGNTAGDYGSGIRVAVKDASTLAPGRISGTTTANVDANVPLPNCQVYDRYNFTSFAVTCDGWCVPLDGACETGITTCCTGTCTAGTCQ